MSTIPTTITPVLTVTDGKPTCLSTDLAQHFNKRHDNVMQAIQNLLPQLDREHALNFQVMSIPVEIGNGATRDTPAYRMTRDGFTLLAMGFNGKRALAFKLAYIDAFNRMEAELQGKAAELPPPVPVPTRTLNFTFTVPTNDRNSRWLLHTDRTGREVVTELSPETHITTIDQLIQRLMMSPADLGITLSQMLAITHACLRNMHTSAGMYAKRLNIQPAKPMPMPRGQFSSMGIPALPPRSPPAP